MPVALFHDRAQLGSFVAQAEATGIDRVVVGDHVSFRGGQGFDGLLNAAVLAALSERIVVQTGVYLLPLRHPLPVARQIAGIAALAPGRFRFGVGVGGEDRAEVVNCGVDPATRGRRMDESITLLRRLLSGEGVSFQGEFFQMSEATILPIPDPGVPVLIGGRSTSALRRVAAHGDGWIGIWVSPSRFGAAIAEIDELAAAVARSAPPREHAMFVWCGVGEPDSARDLLARTMQAAYSMPFAPFERYAPSGRPAAIAAALWAYVEQGCRDFDLVPVAPDPRRALEGVSEIARVLRGG